MSFVNLYFAIFVAICLLIYYLVPSKYRWIVLLIGSYVFYSFTGIKYIVYICVTTITVYFISVLIDDNKELQSLYLKEHSDLSKDEKKQYKKQAKKKQFNYLLIALVINLGILCFFKYAPVVIPYFNYYRLMLTGNTNFVTFKFIMPLGLSFYTFQALGYIIDVYNGKVKVEKNFFKFALFISFFPQVIQGPISRFDELSKSLYAEHKYDFYNIKSGFTRILWGLFKKLVIADRVASYVGSVVDLNEYGYDGLYVLLAVFFYSMQIYGDFSGGIDITIGVAEMFGIEVTDNFIRPFFSKSISEYWRRWHITLGTWFKDYIFYPLSLFKPILNLGKFVKNKFSKELGKRVPLYLPLIIVWFLTGVWHGSESRFICWGLLNCVLIILGTETEDLSKNLIEKFNINENGFGFKSYRIFKTFWMMSFLRLFDISKSSKQAFHLFKSIFISTSRFDFNEVFTTLKLPLNELIVVLIAIVFLFSMELIQRKGSLRKRIFAMKSPLQYSLVTGLFVLVIVFGYYGDGYNAASFIYGNF